MLDHALGDRLHGRSILRRDLQNLADIIDGSRHVGDLVLCERRALRQKHDGHNATSVTDNTLRCSIAIGMALGEWGDAPHVTISSQSADDRMCCLADDASL